MKTGVEFIAEERKRQVEEKGYNAKHDEFHTHGQLALAACCYASPCQLFVLKKVGSPAFKIEDPWPWGISYDKRHCCKDSSRGVMAKPEEYTDEERLRLLVKSGALIAAEIDRLLRKKGEQDVSS